MATSESGRFGCLAMLFFVPFFDVQGNLRNGAEGKLPRGLC